MNQFDGPLQIQYDDEASKILGGDYWRITKSFRFYLPTSEIANEWTQYDTARWVFVNAGTLTDLGTIFKPARGIIDRDGKAAQAFALHDQLCEYLSITEDGKPKRITRQDADLILYCALIARGVSREQASIIYNSVALYGKVMRIRSPSTTMKKRTLEAAYNFEGL